MFGISAMRPPDVRLAGTNCHRRLLFSNLGQSHKSTALERPFGAVYSRTIVVHFAGLPWTPPRKGASDLFERDIYIYNETPGCELGEPPPTD